jgi:nucleoside-diphosphate-sugar epimerase
MTGATGFIGWHVARRFVENGWQVRALVRPDSPRPVPEGVERIVASLRAADVIAAASGADLLIHMAGVVGIQSADEFRRSNVEATAEVAKAAQRLGVRLVHMSSLGATGPGRPDDPPTEDSPLHPVNLYGESKRDAEHLVRSARDLEWTIIRPTLVYGPRDRNFFPMFRLARRGIFPIPSATAVYNVVHVGDVTRLVEIAATSPAALQETFFAGHPHQVTLRELMAPLAPIYGQLFRPFPIPKSALWLGAQIGSGAQKLGINVPIDRARWNEMRSPGFVCRVDKARERLGFVATIELSEGLRETAEWYERAGWIEAGVRNSEF